MKKIARFSSVLAGLFVLAFLGCKQSDKGASNDKETILKGKTTILVDETLRPIIEDQIEVFQSSYQAKINLDC